MRDSLTSLSNFFSILHISFHDQQLMYFILLGSEVLSFTPKDLYPCSLACSAELLPCSTCVGHQSPASTQHAPPPLSSTLLPRIPLRLVYSHFLEAARSRIIDEICESCKREPNSRPIQRLKGGFLIHPLSANSEWGADWSHHALTRFVDLFLLSVSAC